MSLRFIPSDMDWSCGLCDAPLTPGTVELQYMGNIFKVELPVCPACGAVLIAEDLALGQMLEVEQLLEDK